MKFYKLIVFLIISMCIGCSNSIDTDIELNTFLKLKKFQEAIAEHPIENGSNWIVESNFKRLFYFLDKSIKEETFALFKNGQIQRIVILDKKCILIKIRPDYNNNLMKSKWQELYIAYYDDCECVCHKRINQIDVPQNKIFKIQFSAVSSNI